MVSPPSPDVLSAGDSQGDAALVSPPRTGTGVTQLAAPARGRCGRREWSWVVAFNDLCECPDAVGDVVMLVPERVVGKIVGFNEERAACRWRTHAASLASFCCAAMRRRANWPFPSGEAAAISWGRSGFDPGGLVRRSSWSVTRGRPSAAVARPLGGGERSVFPPYVVSPFDGIRARASEGPSCSYHNVPRLEEHFTEVPRRYCRRQPVVSA
jgi:hypothetical protein